MISRRNWMMTTAALAAGAQSSSAQSASPRNVVISSANGLRACARAMQMLKAGFSIITAFNVVAEHHFSASRLERHAFLRAVELHARSMAYISHHWQHEKGLRSRRDFFKKLVKLNLHRILHRRDLAAQVLPSWEERIFHDYCFTSQYLIESRRPRNYDKHGLVKLRGEGAMN